MDLKKIEAHFSATLPPSTLSISQPRISTIVQPLPFKFLKNFRQKLCSLFKECKRQYIIHANIHANIFMHILIIWSNKSCLSESCMTSFSKLRKKFSRYFQRAWNYGSFFRGFKVILSNLEIGMISYFGCLSNQARIMPFEKIWKWKTFSLYKIFRNTMGGLL